MRKLGRCACKGACSAPQRSLQRCMRRARSGAAGAAGKAEALAPRTPGPGAPQPQRGGAAYDRVAEVGRQIMRTRPAALSMLLIALDRARMHVCCRGRRWRCLILTAARSLQADCVYGLRMCRANAPGHVRRCLGTGMLLKREAGRASVLQLMMPERTDAHSQRTAVLQVAVTCKTAVRGVVYVPFVQAPCTAALQSSACCMSPRRCPLSDARLGDKNQACHAGPGSSQVARVAAYAELSHAPRTRV